MPHPTEHSDTRDAAPSRSERRRDALGTLALARQLAELSPARLNRVDLPDDIREEIDVVRHTPSHVAHKRQLAHLAKLMRRCDDDVFAPVRAALANDRTSGAREAAALHQNEALREQLLGPDGETALTAFIASHPEVDRQQLRALIRRSRTERGQGKPPRAQRELFRLLRDSV